MSFCPCASSRLAHKQITRSVRVARYMWTPRGLLNGTRHQELSWYLCNVSYVHKYYPDVPDWIEGSVHGTAGVTSRVATSTACLSIDLLLHITYDHIPHPPILLNMQCGSENCHRPPQPKKKFLASALISNASGPLHADFQPSKLIIKPMFILQATLTSAHEVTSK